MKMIGLMMIFAGCASCGCLLVTQYKKRLAEIFALIDAFEQIKGDIDYRLTPLPEACIHVSKGCKADIGHLFQNFGEMLENKTSMDIESSWQQVLRREKYRYHLTKSDYDILETFGEMRSYNDKLMQKKELEWLIDKLRSVSEELQKEEEKTQKLYTGIGILGGACICILLI
ncbi:MAG: hypothetical protein ACRCSG_08190 [Cellulosilyticaceae bacterium]